MDKEELKKLLKDHLKVWVDVTESMYDEYKFSVRIEFDGELIDQAYDFIFTSKE